MASRIMRVIAAPCVPVELGSGTGSPSPTHNDLRLATAVAHSPDRPVRGAMHAAGSILHRRTAGGRLLVDLDAAEARQQIRRLAMNECAPVELGDDLHGQPQLPPRRLHEAGVGHGAHEVAAQAMNARTLPSITPSQASTVFSPSCAAVEAVLLSLSSGTSSGFSVMPTVRWP